jgi:hypothetical protein
MGSELQYVLYFVPLHKGTCEEIKLVACPVSRIGFPVKKTVSGFNFTKIP